MRMSAGLRDKREHRTYIPVQHHPRITPLARSEGPEMPTAQDALWFKKEFQTAIEGAVAKTP
jgi:hypothetical protein